PAGSLSWIPATGVDVGLTFDCAVVVGVQLPSQPAANQNANYVSLQPTDFADVFKALQGPPNSQLNVVAAVTEANVQVSDNNTAANALNVFSLGNFNSTIANRVQNQAPTNISQQLKDTASFQPTQDLFNALGGAGLSKASYSVVNGELDVKLDQEHHTINVGVGQIQDPYLSGGSGRYYDEAPVNFERYNDLAPDNKAPWVPDPSNPTYNVAQAPWQIDDNNYDSNPYPLDTPTDNVYFQSTRNGRPGADILQDLAPTFLQEVQQNKPLAPQTGDYSVEMEVDVWRMDTVTLQQLGGLQHTTDPDGQNLVDGQQLTGLTNKYPQAVGFFRQLYITYDLGTGAINGVTADGISFSGQVGQSIYVPGKGQNPGLSFTVDLDTSIPPQPEFQVSLPPGGGSLTGLGSLLQGSGQMSRPPGGQFPRGVLPLVPGLIVPLRDRHHHIIWGKFVQTVEVFNLGGQPIQGPIALVLAGLAPEGRHSRSRVRLLNA